MRSAARDAVPAWVGVLAGEVVVGLSDQELGPFTEPGTGGQGRAAGSPGGVRARRPRRDHRVRDDLGRRARRDRRERYRRDRRRASRRAPRRERRPRRALADAGAPGVQRAQVDHRPGGDGGTPRGARREPRRLRGEPSALLPGARCAGRAGASRRHPRGGRRSARRRDRPGDALHDRALQPDPPRGGDGCRPRSPSRPSGPRSERRARVFEGGARTPHLLAAIAELTDGRSLEANLALLAANAGLAGDVAAGLGRLDRGR